MSRLLSQNLKRLRQEKNLTQEEAAEKLGVTPQTISRWECNTTLPDVMLLPEIAKLYCVTVDDLFREQNVAYENYAQRLASVYEDSRDPEDFMRCIAEFEKLFKTGKNSSDDRRMYGIMHQYMMEYCRDKALETFDNLIGEYDANRDEVYWMTIRQRLWLLTQTGKISEGVEKQLERVRNTPAEPQEWICLIQAYCDAEQNEEAYDCFLKAKARFPEEALIYVYGGDLCKKQGKIEEAFEYWDKALELDEDVCDVIWSKGFYYEENGRWQEAYETWAGLAEKYRKDGFTIEMQEPLRRADECMKKTREK